MSGIVIGYNLGRFPPSIGEEMPDQNSAYFSRSMALLRKDKGWMKPLLVLAAASLVPILNGHV